MIKVACWIGEAEPSQESSEEESESLESSEESPSESSEDSPSEERREGNRILPLEMLERIFWLLPGRDLKTVVLVCKRWKEAADNPKLWASSIVFSYNGEHQASSAYGLGYKSQDVKFFQKEVIKARRLQTVRQIKIICCNEVMIPSEDSKDSEGDSCEGSTSPIQQATFIIFVMLHALGAQEI